jgi:hypothetical protein
MIDTDKYEGHTEGPWKPFRLDNMMWTVGNLTVEWQEADKLLIADAPLLLAEVKRLRRVIEDIESMIPDNHEEVSPILSDILSECHRVLPMFNEVSE